MAYDVIVVLGAALGDDGRLGPALEERMQAGVRAWRAGRAPSLLVTGACEAVVMRARALELGVPEGAILVEPTARTTRENALRSAEIMRRRDLRHALVVTQPYHLRRSVASFRRAGVRADGLEGVPGGAHLRMWARERVALAIYALLGWI